MHFQTSDRDGLKAWLIFAMVCINGSLLITHMTSYGLVYMHLMDYFGFSSTQAQFIPSIYMGMRLIIGPLMISTIQRLGFRKANLLGCILLITGSVCSFFATGYIAFLVTMGVIPMISLSLALTSNTFLIKDILKRNRAKAFGILFCAYGISNMILQYFYNWMIDKYTIRGFFLILAALQMNTIVTNMFYLNIKFTQKKQNTRDQFVAFYTVSKRPEVTLFYLAQLFCALSTNTGMLLIMDNGRLYNYDKNWILFLPVLEEIIGIPFRFISGFFFDLDRMQPWCYIIYCLFIFIFCTSHLLNSFAWYSYYFLVACMVIRGIGKSVFISQLILPATFLARADSEVHVIFLLASSCRGAGVFIGNAISGTLKDTFGTYEPSLYFLFTTHLFGALLFSSSAIMHRIKAEKELKRLPEPCLVAVNEEEIKEF